LTLKAKISSNLIFYAERDFNGKLKKLVENLIGQGIAFKEQLNYGTIGSPNFYLKTLKIDGKIIEFSSANSRGSFEKFRYGLLFRTTYRNEVYCLAVGNFQNLRVIIIGGKEQISPIVFGPMFISMKLGLPIRYSRYLRLRLFEYSVDEVTLRIMGENEELKLTTSGFNNYRALEFFQPLLKHE